MSTIDTSPVAPEVRLFLARVQRELADLDPDEVREMTDGLEADLSELVAERGSSALGSPAEYAAELRSAAGVSPRTRRRPGWSLGHGIDRGLDRAHARFDRVVALFPLDVRPLLDWLRPLWWIARGWLAAEVVDLVGQRGSYNFAWLPHMRGVGWLVLLGAVVLSGALGLGRAWWRRRVGTFGRVLLLGVNLVGVLGIVSVVDHAPHEARSFSAASYSRGYVEGLREGHRYADTNPWPFADQAGIYADGSWVTNIFPYDASGKPLVGVQLFDQTGRPIKVVSAPECPTGKAFGPLNLPGWTVVTTDRACRLNGAQVAARISYPWTNGSAQLTNVFPLPVRLQTDFEQSPTAFADTEAPKISAFPQASVPKVSLPGIVTSTQRKK